MPYFNLRQLTQVLKEGRLTTFKAEDYYLDGGLSETPCAVFGDHRGQVSALAVLQDGTLASASSYISQLISRRTGCKTTDNNIHLWNPENGERLRTLTGHTCEVYALIALQNGTLVSGSGDGTIRFWNPENGRCLRTITVSRSRVTALTVLQDGTLASGSENGTICVWDPRSGTRLRTFGQVDMVTALVVLRNGTLVSGSIDHTIYLWNPESGAFLRNLKGAHSDWVSALMVLQNGTLVSSSWDRTICFWDPEKGNWLRILRDYTDKVYALTLLQNGTLVSGSENGSLCLWDPNKRTHLATLNSNRVPVTAFANLSGGCLAIGNDQGRIQLHLLRRVALTCTDLDLFLNVLLETPIVHLAELSLKNVSLDARAYQRVLTLLNMGKIRNHLDLTNTGLSPNQQATIIDRCQIQGIKVTGLLLPTSLPEPITPLTDSLAGSAQVQVDDYCARYPEQRSDDCKDFICMTDTLRAPAHDLVDKECSTGGSTCSEAVIPVEALRSLAGSSASLWGRSQELDQRAGNSKLAQTDAAFSALNLDSPPSPMG